jgi:glutathione S-transferase
MGRMRLHEIPYSTNVERVALALAHKGLDVEHVVHDPGDRRAIRALSGQPLAPVLELDSGEVLVDSTVIIRRLEADHPEAPLWPRDPARAAEADVFAEWFNRVWKVAPNWIADGHGTDVHHAELRDSVAVFERLLRGRDHLLADELTVADVLAFPFIKYAARLDAEDTDPFHKVLHEGMSLAAAPRVAAWIERVDALPRA